MSEAAWALEDVVVRRAGKVVLEIPWLEVGRGRVVALVGPNGAGKTTTLRVLAFLERPIAGKIRFFGRPVEGAGTAERRRVTLVDRSPYLFRRSVEANVALGLRIRGEPVEGPVSAALRKVGLEGFGGRAAWKLSAGEAQRVALARALVLSTPAILLDEPTSSIDRERVPEIERIVEELRADGRTVILATHDASQAARLADETIGLDSGRLLPPAQ